MAFTCSDICKVCFPFTDPRSSHQPLISHPADHVRPRFKPGRNRAPVSFILSALPLSSHLSVFFSRGDVVLTSLSTSSLWVVSLTLHVSTQLTSPSQTLLGYLYVCTLSRLHRQAHLGPPGQPRNYSRFVVHDKLPTTPDPDRFSSNSTLHHPQVLAGHALTISITLSSSRRVRIISAFFHDSPSRSNVERLPTITVFLPSEMARSIFYPFVMNVLM